MDKVVFEELVNNKLITDVTFASTYLEDEEKLNNLSFDDIEDVIVTKEVYQYNTPDFSQGGSFVLTNDLIIVSPIIITEDTEIDLNGYNITNSVYFIDTDDTTNCYVFWVKSGKLTLKGSGRVSSLAGSMYDMVIWANGGDVDIYGGKYISNGMTNKGSDCIYSSNGSHVNIYDGEFECLNVSDSFAAPQYAILNEKGNANGTIEVFGGIFYKFNPSDNVSENPKKDFCAEGYKTIELSKDLYQVVKA